MSDTIKDYLVGFGFDVDDSGASKIESMLRDLDTIVKNLAGVLNQATGQMQSFVSGMRQNTESVGQSSEGVKRLTQNTQDYGKAAHQATDKTRQATEKIKDAGKASDKAASSVDKLGKAMSTVKKVAGMIAGAAVVKRFISVAQSMYEFEQGLEQSAQKLNKTTEQARAHENALKAMGKTYDEIQKDKNLKATYDDLVAIGESMALPEGKAGTGIINDMANAFTRLKVMGSYAMQWLYHTVQENASGPLQRMKNTLDDIAKALKLNMPRWISGGARVIEAILAIASAFGRAATDIGKVAMEIVDFFDKIPGPIKEVIATLGLLAIALTAGPVVKITLIMSVLGILLDDFYGYLEGRPCEFGPVWEQVIDLFETIKTSVENAVTAINGFWEDAKGKDGAVDWIKFGLDIGKYVLAGIKAKLGQLSNKFKEWITGDANASWDEVGAAIIQKIKDGISTALTKRAELIQAVFQFIGEGEIPEDISSFLSNAIDFAGAILKAIVDAIPDLVGQEVNNVSLIIDKIAELINGEFVTTNIMPLLNNAGNWITAIILAIVDSSVKLTRMGAFLIKTVIWKIANTFNSEFISDNIMPFLSNCGEWLTAILVGIVNASANIAVIGLDLIESIIDNLATAINGKFVKDDLSKLFGKAGEWVNAIVDAIIDKIPIVTAKGTEVMTRLCTALTDIFNGIGSEEYGDSLGGFVTNIITGAVDILTALTESSGKMSGPIFQAAVSFVNNFNKLLTRVFSKENIDKVGDSIKGFIKSIFKAIGETFQNLGDALEDLDAREIGDSAGEILTNILSKIFKIGSDLSEDDSVTGFVEKLGDGLNTALEKLGEFIGSFAGKIAKWLFSGEAIKDIFNASINLGKLLLRGIEKSIEGIGLFFVGMIDSVLEEFGLINTEEREAYEAAYKQGELYREAIAKGFIDALENPENVTGDQEKYDSVVISALFGDYTTLDENSMRKLYNIMAQKLGLGDEDTNGIAASNFGAEANEMWWALSNSFQMNGGKLSADAAREIIEPVLQNLGVSSGAITDAMYEAIAESFSLDSTGREDIMGVLFSGIIESFMDMDSEEAEQAKDEAVTDAKEKGKQDAEDMMDAYAEGMESGIVSDGIDIASEAGLEGITATLNDGKDDVGEAAAEVSNEAVQAFLLKMNEENGASIAQSFIDGILAKCGELNESVVSIVDKIITKFRSITPQTRNSFRGIATAMKNALRDLPEWIQTNVVDKINERLGTIKAPNLSTPGVEGHSEGGRIDRPTLTTLGEGGNREYVIPVTKKSRAVPLMYQAAADLGLTVQSYANASRMLGGSPDGGITPAHVAASTSSSVVNYNNIDAHAVINVSGSDSKSVADNVNHSHEQVLLRGVKSLLA